ncbi:hypothetical protein RRG08_016325 [Elysia crispata]|uniref:protein-tyrosine-phosphatase n=1 Tax=Elysia crispata TaxID=231223 RepID=A0AAE1E0Z3_9GAST|nr:hypothetical protein RRG08_016325 [Elysia crispata]
MTILHMRKTRNFFALSEVWLVSSLAVLILQLAGQVPACLGQQQLEDVRLTSTEYSVTVTFVPNPAAMNYSVEFRLKRGLFITDFPLVPPFNTSELTQTYTQVLPGHIYVVEIYENGTAQENRVFSQDIATVPLSPENVSVISRGNTFLHLEWVSVEELSYDRHEISYIRENGSLRVIETPSNLTYNITGLEAGYSYDIYVVAITLDVRSQRSRKLVAFTIPFAPVNVSASAVGTSQINITWSADPASYQDSHIVNYTLSESDIELSTLCSDTPCVFSPHSRPGESISIAVFAVSHALTSPPAIIQHSTEPGSVTQLQAEEGVRSLHLSWLAPLDSYQVLYVITVTSLVDQVVQVFRVNADLLSYELDSLRGGYIYQVQVQAASQFELGDAGSEIFRTLPEPVTNLTGSAVNTTAIRFTWINPLYSEIDKLNITVSTPDGEVIMLLEEDDVMTTGQTVTGLSPGVSYMVNISILSKYSDPSAAAFTLIRTKPVPPAILDVINGETTLNITLAPSAVVGLLDSLLAMLDGGLVQHIADNKGQVAFSNLEPGTAYIVRAFSLSGQVRSDEITVTLYTRPRPVSDLIVLSLGEQAVSAQWTAPDRGGFDNFTVLVSDVDGITSPMAIITNKLETVVEDLHPGTTYNISIIVLKGEQDSEAVWEVNTTTPLPVTHVRVSVRGIDTVTLAWDAPAASALSGFALTFDPLNLTLTPLPVGVDQFKLEGLQPDTNYTAQLFTYSVRPGGERLYSAVTAFNFSTYEKVIQALAKGKRVAQLDHHQPELMVHVANPYPESVAALQKVEALTTSITVNWTAPTSVNIDFFQLGIQAEDPATKPIPRPMNVPKNLTSTTFEGLEPGLQYTVAIRTGKLLSGNQAQYGESVRLRAVTKPLPVQELRVETLNTTAVSLMWDSNSTSRQNRFRITYRADELSRSLTVPAGNESGQSYQIDVGQLLPGYTYSLSVVAIRAIETDLAESDEGSVMGYTVPSPVRNLTLSHEGTDLLIAWSPPASGLWMTYKVMYRSVLRDNETVPLLRTSGRNENSMRITDLFPGEMYKVEVVSISNDLESELKEADTVFNPLPPTNFNYVKDLTTTTGLTLTWAYNMESTYTEHWSVIVSAGQVREVKTVEANRKQLEYSLALISLVPGETYTVSISAVVMEQKSDIKHLEATTKPVITSDLTPSPSTNSSVSLRYTITESDIFDHILFSLPGNELSAPIMKTKEDLKRSITFDGLEAGTKYTVRTFTVSKGERSAPKSLDLITDPNPVPVTFSSTSTSIVLTLGPQVGQAAEYIISCSVDSESCGQKSIPSDRDAREILFDGLRPYQAYSFEVVTRAEMLRGQQKQTSLVYEHTTDEAAPSVVRSLRVQAQGIHSVSIDWQPPESANGRLRSYTVAYAGSEPTDPVQRDMKIIKDIPITTTSQRLDNLRAGFSYMFSVFALTTAQSEAAKQSITMGTTAPAFRPGLSAVKAKPALLDSSTGGISAVTQTKISLTFTNPFSSENGNIRFYTVIVSKDESASGSSPILPSWADAQADSSIKVYQTINQCEDFFSASSSCGDRDTKRSRRAANSLDSRTFIIGEETNCTRKAFCNGPLSPNTEYYVKLRGFTASGQYEETAYSEKILTAKSSSSNAGIAAGIGSTIAVLVGVGVVIVVIVMRRRRRPKRATKHVGPKANWEQSTMCKFSRPVKLSDFPAHVRKMAADSDFKYAEEYEDLKEVGRDQPCLAAEFPPNRPKNRFTNILPYDHSRVKLLPTDDDEGSDYINANYMPGFNSKREYIATQGPLPATRDDFWRMVWEQSSRNIVMLTRCQEKGREKSDHYWPNDSDPKFYGDLHVVILNETHMPDWTVTEIRVSLGEQSRNVRHFHYKIWPDFGVPKDRTSLIRFVRMVRERLVREGGPIITHCSAGVGRSGTFIVLDHLLQMIREKDEVDIFSIVYKLRKERVLMVQTELQYKFIHECLLCVLEGKEDDTTYANVGQVNVGFDDDEGINVMEVP